MYYYAMVLLCRSVWVCFVTIEVPETQNNRIANLILLFPILGRILGWF